MVRLATALQSHGRKMKGILLVDVPNLYITALNYYDRKIDFRRVLEIARRRVQDLKAYAFMPDDGNGADLRRALESMGYSVISKPCKVVGNRLKGDMDVDIAICVQDFLYRLPSDSQGVIVIASGDGDFKPLCERAHEKGVEVVVISFPESLAGELEEVADEVIYLGSEDLLGKNREEWEPEEEEDWEEEGDWPPEEDEDWEDDEDPEEEDWEEEDDWWDDEGGWPLEEDEYEDDEDPEEEDWEEEER